MDRQLLAPNEEKKIDINGTQIGGTQPGSRTLSGEFGLHAKRKNPYAEIKQELTSGWFDTNEEFEQHRKRVTRKLHQSVKDFKELTEGGAGIDDGKLMEVLASEGGKKGYTVLGGPTAFDASSNAGGAYSAMLSEMDVLSRYDGKWQYCSAEIFPVCRGCRREARSWPEILR